MKYWKYFIQIVADIFCSIHHCRFYKTNRFLFVKEKLKCSLKIIASASIIFQSTNCHFTIHIRDKVMRVFVIFAIKNSHNVVFTSRLIWKKLKKTIFFIDYFWKVHQTIHKNYQIIICRNCGCPEKMWKITSCEFFHNTLFWRMHSYYYNNYNKKKTQLGK